MMKPANVVVEDVTTHTKERILHESMKMFAVESYDGVSIRDIAAQVGIKSSSIYNYYDGKEELLRDILGRFAARYSAYFAWLRTVNRDELTLERFLDNLFERLISAEDQDTCYGVAIVLKEQFNNDTARDMAFQLFHQDYVHSLAQLLDGLVDRGVIPRCDSTTMAALVMYCMLIGATLRMHELLGHPTPVSSTKLYLSLKEFLHSALKKGI